MTDYITKQGLEVLNNSSGEAVTLSTVQQVVFNWLNDELELPVYANVYKGALNILSMDLPGCTKFVSHAGRELMNGLVRTVNGIKSDPVQYVNLVNKLQEDWKNQWGTEELNTEESTENGHLIPREICGQIKIIISDYQHATHSGLVTLLDEVKRVWRDEWDATAVDTTDRVESGQFIPYKVCKQIQNLIDEHMAGRERAEGLGPLFFTTFLDYIDIEQIPLHLLKEWKQAKSGFQGRTHIGDSKFNTEQLREVKRHFRTLEDLLFAAASTEIERLGTINEILEETNE